MSGASGQGRWIEFALGPAHCRPSFALRNQSLRRALVFFAISSVLYKDEPKASERAWDLRNHDARRLHPVGVMFAWNP